MIYFELSAQDLLTASEIGLARDANKQLAGVYSRRFDAHSSDSRIHIVGAMGEIAVARCYGLQVNTDLYLDGDGGVDFTLPDGRTVDVKTRGEPNCDLLTYPGMSDFTADYAVLCWLMKPGAVGIVGYVAREDFALESVLLDKPDRACLSWRQLTPLRLGEHNGLFGDS